MKLKEGENPPPFFLDPTPTINYNVYMSYLKITYENAKLIGIFHFSLPSGYSCPGASNCKTFADRMTGKIRDEQKPDADGIIYRLSLIHI